MVDFGFTKNQEMIRKSVRQFLEKECPKESVRALKKDPRGYVFYGGHLGVFTGPDGRKWFSYRIEKDNAARGLLAIDPFDIDSRGKVQAEEPTLGPQTIPLNPMK